MCIAAMLFMLIDWLYVARRSVHMNCHNVDWLIGCGSQVGTLALPHVGYVNWLIGCDLQVGTHALPQCWLIDWSIGCGSQVSTRALPHVGYVKWMIGCGSKVGTHTLPHVDWLIICGTQVGTRALPRPTRTRSPATSTSLSLTWRPVSRSGRGIREFFF